MMMAEMRSGDDGVAAAVGYGLGRGASREG